MIKEAFFLIDGLTNRIRASALKSAVLVVPEIRFVKADTYYQILGVAYQGRDPEKYVRMACKAVGSGISFRSRIKKRDLRKLDLELR